MMVIPPEFAQGIVAEGGQKGSDWVAQLPELVDHLCRQWDLVVEGGLMHGYLAIVVPVRRGTESMVLKVSWIDTSTEHEIQALRAWQGAGAVRLVASDGDRGALLLERLDADHPLTSAPIGEALSVAGELLRRLAIRVDHGFPTLAELVAELVMDMRQLWHTLGQPIPMRLVEEACEVGWELAESASRWLVDYDLHYGNILAADREPWLAIDPKVVVGDVEYGVAPLLWTRLDDLVKGGGVIRGLDHLIAAADLDPILARRWILFRCVEYWLWGLGLGLTEDPARCQYIVEMIC